VLLQADPVNGITNLIFLFVFNRNMRLFVSDKYPQVYRLATQGPKFSPVATGRLLLAPQTKF